MLIAMLSKDTVGKRCGGCCFLKLPSSCLFSFQWESRMIDLIGPLVRRSQRRVTWCSTKETGCKWLEILSARAIPSQPSEHHTSVCGHLRPIPSHHSSSYSTPPIQPITLLLKRTPQITKFSVTSSPLQNTHVAL